MQAPTQGPKAAGRHYWIDPHRTFVRASFVGKRGQCGSRENCILLENGPTQSLFNRASQRSSLAVCKFRTASKEHCGRGYVQLVCANLAAGCIVVPETHWNSLRELRLWTFQSPRKYFAWWAVTRRTLQTTELSKLGGGPLRAEMSASLTGTVWYVHYAYITSILVIAGHFRKIWIQVNVKENNSFMLTLLNIIVDHLLQAAYSLSVWRAGQVYWDRVRESGVTTSWESCWSAKWIFWTVWMW